MKTLRIEELEKKVESLKKKKHDERKLREAAETSHLKVKEELARFHEAKINEDASFKKKAKEIAARYRHSLNSIGCDIQLLAEFSAAPFMD